MHTVFFICSVVGGALLLFQFIALVFGGGDGAMEGAADVADVDMSGADISVDGVDVSGVDSVDSIDSVDAGIDDVSGPDSHSALDAAESAAFTVISFRTLVAFVTFFGLGGMGALASELTLPWTLGVAIVAGLVALYGVAYLWWMMMKLAASGNVRLRNAVGRTATVYLKVPGSNAGSGKVTVKIQGRTVECKAVTEGEEIATGQKAKVVAVVGSDTLRVEPVV